MEIYHKYRKVFEAQMNHCFVLSHYFSTVWIFVVDDSADLEQDYLNFNQCPIQLTITCMILCESEHFIV